MIVGDKSTRKTALLKRYGAIAVGCLILFDVSRGSTFEGATELKNDLDNKVRLPDMSPIPCVLIANKVNTDCLLRMKIMNLNYIAA